MRWRLTILIALVSLAGCQPAGRYTPAPRSKRSEPTSAVRSVTPPATQPDSSGKPPLKPLSPELAWMEPTPTIMEPAVPILFVHRETSRAEWEKLPQFWNAVALPPRPAEAAALLGATPIAASVLAAIGPGPRAVKIKVPAGLDDPTSSIPASNPPTVGKWELGKQLFFDRDNLLPASPLRGMLACASCHQPTTGFTNPKLVYPRRPSPLINVVYNRFQFWDGRVTALEEVVQRGLEDERSATDSDQQHAWSWVVTRLRDKSEYVQRFRRVFGTLPTQDAVGKALATYMRTILAGDSLQDRAEEAVRQRKGKLLEAQDYENVLTDAVARDLLDPEPMESKEEVAKKLHEGYTLFHGKARCVQCHGGGQYTDGSFHNLGIGDSSATRLTGDEVGRFRQLPPGLKDVRMIGAYKTPGLRSILRTAPYGHDGLRHDLFLIIQMHVRPIPGPYLDPDIRERFLREEDIRALVLFVKALNGEPVAPVVADAPK